ncbi:MAG: ATP-binding protein [Oscillospiraceae bacterium]|nr:ATP-binding protein [Oscillospiraceae bacterium]
MSEKNNRKILTEAMLRALCLPRGACVPVPPGTALTPLAREYIAAHGLAITECPSANAEGMEKPEHMTHLNASALVPKTHPRIHLRGKLDSLEALLLQMQALALERGRGETAGALGEVHDLAQRVLAAEVKGEPLGPFTLLGLDSAALRAASHDPMGCAGLDAHPAPHVGMERLCLALNFLRTQVRETELAAAQAFCLPDGTVERPDLLEALNRMSSAVYLVFMREIRP